MSSRLNYCSDKDNDMVVSTFDYLFLDIYPMVTLTTVWHCSGYSREPLLVACEGLVTSNR